MPSLLDSIFGKQKLEDVALDEIYSVIAEFPSFNAAHFLLSKKLKAANDPAFPEETKKTALYFNNPVWLQFLLDEEQDGDVANRGPAFRENLRSFSGAPDQEDEMPVFTSFEQREVISVDEEIKEPVSEDERPEQEEYEEYREPGPEIEEQAPGFNFSEPDFKEPVQDYHEPESPKEYGETLQEETEAEPLEEYGETLSEETEFPEAVGDFHEAEPLPEYNEPGEEHRASPPGSPESVEEFGESSEVENSGEVMEHQEPESGLPGMENRLSDNDSFDPPSYNLGYDDHHASTINEEFREADQEESHPALTVNEEYAEALQDLPVVNQEFEEDPHPAITVNEEYAEALQDLPVVNQEFEEDPHPAITVNEEYARKEAEIPTIHQELAGEAAVDPLAFTPEDQTDQSLTASKEEGSFIQGAPEETAIGQTLSSQPPFDAKKAEAIVFEPYHMIDYFASQGIGLVMEDHPTDSFGKQLKSFTDWLKVMKRLPQKQLIPEKTDEWETDRIRRFAASSIEERDILTETMAEVLAKQGMYENAIALYQKLSLIYPPKSAYFASRIEQLKASLS